MCAVQTARLQVSQKPTIAPIAKDEAGGFSAPPGRKSGYARAIGEMMLIVRAQAREVCLGFLLT